MAKSELSHNFQASLVLSISAYPRIYQPLIPGSSPTELLPLLNVVCVVSYPSPRQPSYGTYLHLTGSWLEGTSTKKASLSLSPNWVLGAS